MSSDKIRQFVDNCVAQRARDGFFNISASRLVQDLTAIDSSHEAVEEYTGIIKHVGDIPVSIDDYIRVMNEAFLGKRGNVKLAEGTPVPALPPKPTKKRKKDE